MSRGSIDDVLGIVRKEEILAFCLDNKPFDVMGAVHQPIATHAGASILETFELFKRAPVEMVLVVDEYGSVQGIVTRTDLLEAIAGDLPDAENEEPEAKELDDGSLLLDGAMSIYEAQQRVELGKLPDGDFNTLAGLIVFLFGRIPAIGERIHWGGWSFEVSDYAAMADKQSASSRVGADSRIKCRNRSVHHPGDHRRVGEPRQLRVDQPLPPRVPDGEGAGQVLGGSPDVLVLRGRGDDEVDRLRGVKQRLDLERRRELGPDLRLQRFPWPLDRHCRLSTKKNDCFPLATDYVEGGFDQAVVVRHLVHFSRYLPRCKYRTFFCVLAKRHGTAYRVSAELPLGDSD